MPSFLHKGLETAGTLKQPSVDPQSALWPEGLAMMVSFTVQKYSGELLIFLLLQSSQLC